MVDQNTLEATLKNQQWVGGQTPTNADQEAFEAVKDSDLKPDTHPHLFAWFCLVSKFTEPIRKSWAAAAAKGGKGGAAKGGKKGGGSMIPNLMSRSISDMGAIKNLSTAELFVDLSKAFDFSICEVLFGWPPGCEKDKDEHLASCGVPAQHIQKLKNFIAETGGLLNN